MCDTLNDRPDAEELFTKALVGDLRARDTLSQLLYRETLAELHRVYQRHKSAIFADTIYDYHIADGVSAAFLGIGHLGDRNCYGCAVRAYANRAVSNRLASAYRRRAAKPQCPLSDAASDLLPDEAVKVEDEALGTRVAEEFLEAVANAGLTRWQRTVLAVWAAHVVDCCEEDAVKHAAARLGRTEAAIYAVLSRIKDRLQPLREMLSC